MAKNSVYTIVTGDEAREYSSYCLPSQQSYCEFIDADFYVMGDEAIRPEYPTGHFNLISAIEHFLEGSSERFLYLDADIIIHKNTPDIFKEFPSGNIYLRKGHEYKIWYEWMVENQQELSMDGLEFLFENYWSSGIILADRDQLKTLMSKFTPPYVVGQWGGEMGHLNWAVATSGLKPKELPPRWHFTRIWADGYKNKSLSTAGVDSIEDIYMMHYAVGGPKTPFILKDIETYGYMGFDRGDFLDLLGDQMNVNAGVIQLASHKLTDTILADRLDIEDNIGESIHIHYKNLRLDFTVRDFINFAEACSSASGKLSSNSTMTPTFIEHPVTMWPPQGMAHISEPRVINREMRWYVLFDLIEEHKFNNIVEVGSQEGRTPWYILNNTSRESVRVDIVDPYLVYDGYGYKEPFEMSVVEKQAKHWLSDFVESGRCVFHKKYSVDGSKLYEDNSLDLVFIDANHTYPHVKADIEHWYPKVKPGGILAGHDYGPDFPGVEKACLEFFNPKNKKISLSHNRVWIVYK